MLARRQLRLAVVAELQKLVTGVTVQSPGNLAVPNEKLPVLRVSVPGERKQSIQRGMPEFNTTCTLQVIGELQGDTPEAAQDAIEDLGYRVETAILNGYWIVAMVQQFASITTDTELKSEGREHLAGFRMLIECELYESFDPTVPAPDGTTWPLDDPVLRPFQGVNLHVDTAAPFDATGTYPPSPFPGAVPDAPRTTGPDGRDEGYLQIDLPQT